MGPLGLEMPNNVPHLCPGSKPRRPEADEGAFIDLNIILTFQEYLACSLAFG